MLIKPIYKTIFIRDQIQSFISLFCDQIIEDIEDISIDSNEILLKFLKRFKEFISKEFGEIIFKSREYKKLGYTCNFYEIGLRDIADMVIEDPGYHTFI